MSQIPVALKRKQTGNKEDRFPPKPQRPLTSYGIFSVLERNYIWQQNKKPSSATTTTTTTNSNEDSDDSYTATRPQRYRDIELPPNWWVVGMNRKKRNDHVTHGKITFNQLSKSIAERWRTVDAETKGYCEMIANEEHRIYQIELAAYVEVFGEEAVKAQNAKKPRHSSRSPEKSRRTVDNSANKPDSTITSNDSAEGYTQSILFGAARHETNPRSQNCLPGDRSTALESVGDIGDIPSDELRNIFDSYEEV